MVEAAASAIAVEAYKDGRSIFGYINQKITYADDFKDNFEKMMNSARTLYARRDDVEEEISNNKMKRATKECEDWISRVEVAKEKVLELESKYNKETTYAWRLPRFRSRANLSKQMAKKHVELQALLKDGELNNRVLAERPPERVIVIDAPRTEDKPSLHWAVEEILSLMRDKNIRNIGLWGWMGSGKTTIMQNLNNNEEIGNMFDIVIWVSVSKNRSIKEVQDAIMRRLKLKVKGVTTTEETAQLISNKLRGIRYLLLLDEVWYDFGLPKIGVSNNDRDSKVVLASRSLYLCRDMNADELVNLKRMSYVDAFKMFEEKVGRIMEDPNIISIAKVVVRRCAGLPFLIDKFAKTFRKKDNIHLWNEGLKNLRRWPSNKFEGMEEVIEFLRFCYENLNGNDKKDCFLYGALFPEECDIYVNYLMECWKAEGFLHNIDQLRDARDRGHQILADLKDASLLEEGAMKEHVRMNKVIREMALKISSQVPDHKFLARTCEELEEAPKEEEWASSSRISLIDSDMHSLPAAPNCMNLSTLLLQRNNNLMSIPESFFLSMKRLRVLDLQQSAIQSLPSSLSFLTDLRALYLNSCTHLTKLPSSLEGLLHLEVLDIRRTGISLPIQVGCLAQMKCLRMSSSNFGTGGLISNVISSLTLLEELIIELDPNPLWSDQVVMTIIEEVSTLTRLSLLTFSFPKVEGLESFIRSSRAWKEEDFTFQFVVGICDSVEHDILDYYKYPLCRFLKYAKGEGVRPVISKVLTKTNVFELIDHKNISSLSDFNTENMTKLRACSVDGCQDIICIIDGNVAAQPTFQYLDRMVIKNAPSLHCIWMGHVHGASLGRMNSLTLYNCPKLKEIFSKGLIEQLAKLEHLSVEECHEIEEIIIEFENHCLDRSTLPKLKKLVLRDLPKLRRITPDDSLIWPSLERVEIASCRSLLKLPFSGENAINLRSIDAEESWWSTLVWRDIAIKQRLQPLCKFTY